MLKRFIRSRLGKYERDLGYDATYLRDVLDADLGAFLRFARLQGVSTYRRDAPKDVWYAAKIVGAMSEDCGPCTQLVVTMAERDGVDGATLAAIVRGDLAALPAEVALGVRFARAVLAHDPAADELREEIVRAWGKRALVSISFSLVSARLYPTLKYAMGHGRACQRVLVGGAPIAVAHAS
ncbi:MAG TPA: hypothetical protein VL463_06360 [Kofleriaceae bacterium]|nr:hypothetical protein [Kofleriaceae bacterium]